MSRKLAWLAVGGLVLGGVCIAAAFAVGGRDFFRHFDFDDGDFGRPRCGVSLAGRDDTRAIDWTGGDEAGIRIPADVQYRRGEGDKLIVRGDAALLPLVRVEKGVVRFTCRMRHPGKVSLTLPGRDFTRFSMFGTGDVTLEGIDQPRLEINVAGASDVTATGRTGKLEYNLMGSGDSKFQGLQAEDAELNIFGSGDTDVAVTGRLEINVFGSGDVRLHGEPAHLENNIFGSGSIIHDNGDVSRTHGMSHGETPPPPEPPKGI